MPHPDLVSSVLDALPAGADSVAMPDHPLLLTGPDILASFRGNLTAYFVVMTKIRRPAAVILPKVTLARLALPRTTNFVLVLTDREAPIDELAPFFEEIVEGYPARHDYLPIGRLPSSAAVDLLEPLRVPHNERFAEAWTTSTGIRRRRRRISGRPTSELSPGRPLPTPGLAPYADYQNGQYVFGQPNIDDTYLPRTWLSAATILAVRTDYLLDRGADGLGEVAGLTSLGEAYLPLHKSWLPVHASPREFDLLKRFRAAAFAGIATTIQEEYVAQETR